MKKSTLLISILFLIISPLSIFSQKIKVPSGYYHNKTFNYQIIKPKGWKELNQNKNIKVFIKNPSNVLSPKLVVTSFLSVPVPDESEQKSFKTKISEQLAKVKGGKLVSYKFSKYKGMDTLKVNTTFIIEKVNKKTLKKPLEFNQIFQIFYTKGNQYSIIGAFPKSDYKNSIKSFNNLISTFKCTQTHISKIKKVSFLSSYLPIVIIFFFVIIGFLFLKNRKPKF